MKFTLESFALLPKVHFYTVKLDGAKYAETEDFFRRFGEDAEFRSDAAEIKATILKIGQYGAREEFFKVEDAVRALPITWNNLRLYCIRCTSDVVILCNGGRKTSKKIIDSPGVLPHFKFTKEVDKIFVQYIQEGDTTYSDKEICGELTFDSDL